MLYQRKSVLDRRNTAEMWHDSGTVRSQIERRQKTPLMKSLGSVSNSMTRSDFCSTHSIENKLSMSKGVGSWEGINAITLISQAKREAVTMGKNL